MTNSKLHLVFQIHQRNEIYWRKLFKKNFKCSIFWFSTCNRDQFFTQLYHIKTHMHLLKYLITGIYIIIQT